MNQEERNEYLKNPSCGTGWDHIIRKLDQDLSQLDPEYEIIQIKEKFGGLRYYFAGKQNVIEQMYELVRNAEQLAWDTCEQCGSTNNVTTQGPEWLHTFCDKCEEKIKETYAFIRTQSATD